MAAKDIDRRRIAARFAAIVKHRGPDDPRLPELRRDLAVEELRERITDVITATPEPTESQRRGLALILLGGTK